MELQAVDRLHRLGQMKPVFIYRVVLEDKKVSSVERRIIDLQADKMEMAKASLGEGPLYNFSRQLRQLSERDLMKLLLGT